MKASTPSFRGMAPRLSPRLLPDNASQEAINARLLTGALRAWNRPLLEHQLPEPYMSCYKSIFLLNDVWLAWTEHVSAARGTILGDTTYRTFLTGPEVYGEPRFTNYALATSGPEPYPFATRPLGVPGPETAPTLVLEVAEGPTTFSVNEFDEGNVLASEWVISPPGDGGGTYTRVEQDATDGNPAPSYKLTYDEVYVERQQAYMYRNFGIADTQVMRCSFDFQFGGDLGVKQAGFIGGATSSGAGVMAAVDDGQLRILTSNTWNFYGAAIAGAIATPSLAGGTWYTMEVTAIVNDDLTQTVTATLYEGSGQLATVTATVNVGRGAYCGFVNAKGADADPRYITHYDNLLVQASGVSNIQILNLATSYVYTYVNDLGQESAPSPASVTIQRPDGVQVTVTTPTVVESGVSDDYGITTKRLYRATTGALGSVFRFVAELALGTADYVDVLTDSELGEDLETTDWDLPPDDLRFILALPNGIMVGASGNQLCLSARNRPHAWPVSYRLPTDTEITGLGNVDTSVVIGTKSFVYTASGNEPENYSMSKPGAPHACVSARSFAYLLRIGVVFAGPDGLMAVNGPTDVVNLTETTFTREQWQALQPETIIGLAHDDIYFFFYGDPEGSGPKGGYALDMKPNGFGLIKLGMHASAMAADLENDALILCLDEYTEPQGSLLPPVTGSDLTADCRTLYEWNAGTELMRYSWTGKLWLSPYPGAFQWVRVRAADYDDLEMAFTADGAPLMSKIITSDKAFRVPTRATYNALDWTAIGTSRVYSVEIADDVAELV